jgi:large subunit ribosomal protein L30
MGLLLVVNIHGKINSPSGVRKALAELKVERRFTASLVTDDTPTVGVLKSCKDYLAWAPLDQDVLTLLLEKRGMVSETKKLDSEALSRMGFKSHEELAAKISKEGMKLSSVEGLRPFFKLSPPKGGFKRSLRRQFSEGGTLGRNPNLAEIVERMA